MRIHGRRVAAAFIVWSLVLGLLTASAASAASPRIRWVDGDGHGGGSAGCNGTRSARLTIQGAIDASSAGDIVRVCPGTYHETVVVNKVGLTVAGVKALKAKIVPPANDTSSAGLSDPAVLVTANRVTLRKLNVVIPDTCDYIYTGITVSSARHVRVLDSRVAERSATSGGSTECGINEPSATQRT